MNLEVVWPHPDDGGDMAVATPDDLIEATEEAISMAQWCPKPFLRIDGVVTNYWVNHAWEPPLNT